MTGLDTKNDALIEVAALVTDSELNILGDGVDVVIKPDDAALAQMNDFVRDMHTRSGLLAELPHGKTMAEAQALVLEYIKKWVPDRRRPRWAATRWAPTVCSWSATCRSSWNTCTTA